MGEELQDIFKLESMGFDLQRSIDAYISSGKVQFAAIDLLVESPPEGKVTSASTLGIAQSSVCLTAEEEEAPLTMAEHVEIQRIQELGFDRPTALKAYLFYGKDEQKAANQLLR